MATVLKTPPPLSAIAAAPLRGADGSTVTGAALWADRPVVVYVLRRPGCLLCRATAKRIAALQPVRASRGVGLACVANAWIEPEIAAFVDGYFPQTAGGVYLDETKAFFTAVGGGAAPRRGSLTAFLNPFGRVWQNSRAAKETVTDHNLTGDGLTMGGLLVVSGSKGVVYAAYETTFGDAPSDEDILAAADKAVA